MAWPTHGAAFAALARGVALAAIQGLNQKLEDRYQKADIRVQNLEAENAQLKRQLAEIRALVQSLADRSQTRGTQEKPTAENAEIAQSLSANGAK
jgi:phage shock protein A